jgi:hypothetical protein
MPRDPDRGGTEGAAGALTGRGAAGAGRDGGPAGALVPPGVGTGAGLLGGAGGGAIGVTDVGSWSSTLRSAQPPPVPTPREPRRQAAARDEVSRS